MDVDPALVVDGGARAIGARVVAIEELDALFAGGVADPGQPAALTAAIGALNGRAEVHPTTHIAMRDVLEPVQREAYARLWGCAAAR